MAELGTFGAIVRFAITLEEQAADFYERPSPDTLHLIFAKLARQNRQRSARLERARQEMVAEMILESITGLTEESYRLELGPVTAGADLHQQAQTIEKTVARFYRDAAEKIPIREVSRLFNRLAQENDRREAELTRIP